MIYLTADWHNGELQAPGTHSYLRPRPTEVMVEEWLKQCHILLKPEDAFIFLGDIGITLDDLKILQRLPVCHKILVMGDKEYASKTFSVEAFQTRNHELKIFHEVYRATDLHIAGRHYFLAHKPTECVTESAKLQMPALCGHVHGIWRTQRMPNGQPIINVVIDAWGGLVSEAFIAHQYDCVTKGYYDENCFPVDWYSTP